jgi:hypothetical protein
MSKENFRFLAAWLLVGVVGLAIFLVVPLARIIQDFVAARWGRSVFGFFVLASVGAFFLALFWFLFFRLRIRRASNYVWLALVAGLYVFFTLKLWRAPEEAVHFLEYGLLGFCLFRALSLSIRDRSVYLTAFFIGALVGTFDEFLQWLTPGRYWDFRDVGLNALATGLFLVAVRKGVNPPVASARPSARSVRRISALLAVQIIILGLCASNTPARVAALVRRFPSLGFLLREEPMYEFTKKHADSEIGVFYSRLSLEGLAAEDLASSDHWADVLRDWADKSYNDFLNHHSPLIHPFVYEMRVHLFRRDRKLEEARRVETERARRKALFVAFKENRILEKHFGRTLEKSGYGWSPELRAEVGSAIDVNKRYRSPVSAGLFQVKEKTLWAGILACLVALASANFVCVRKRTRRAPETSSPEPAGGRQAD